MKIQLRKPASCDADAVDKAEGSIWRTEYCEVAPGSPESLARGMLLKGFSRNPGELPHLLLTTGGTDRQGKPETIGIDG